MKHEYQTEQEATEVLKEAVWLAWQACPGTFGMGAFQDNPKAQREEVWSRAYGEGDYFGRKSYGQDLNADYVFGRMMKLRIKRPTATTLEIPESEPRRDYQSWCGKFKTYASLFDAAENVIRKTKDAA